MHKFLVGNGYNPETGGPILCSTRIDVFGPRLLVQPYWVSIHPHETGHISTARWISFRFPFSFEASKGKRKMEKKKNGLATIGLTNCKMKIPFHRRVCVRSKYDRAQDCQSRQAPKRSRRQTIRPIDGRQLAQHLNPHRTTRGEERSGKRGGSADISEGVLVKVGALDGPESGLATNAGPMRGREWLIW